MSTAVREDPDTQDIESLDAKIKHLKPRDRDLDMLTRDEKLTLLREATLDNEGRKSVYPYVKPPASQVQTGAAAGLIPVISTGDNYPGFRMDGKLVHQRVLDGIHSQLEETGVEDKFGNMKTVTKIYRARRTDDPPDYTGDQFLSPFDHTTLNQSGPAFQKFAKVETHDIGIMDSVNPLMVMQGETPQAYAMRMKRLSEEAMRLMEQANKQQVQSQQAQVSEVLTASKPASAIPAPQQPQTQNLTRHPSEIASLREKLKNMSLKNIQEFASGEEIELSPGTNKEDAIKTILADPRYAAK